MGLDNIPKTYPCQKAGTAVLDEDGRIDCEKTINAGRCPWNESYNSDPMVSKSKPTYGMLGTKCWYRGKYGNAMLGLLEHGDFNTYFDGKYSFYGEGFDDGKEGISPDDCLEMSKWMGDNTEKFASQARAYALENPDCDIEGLISDWMYATWWLKFVAENADGSAIWY